MSQSTRRERIKKVLLTDLTRPMRAFQLLVLAAITLAAFTGFFLSVFQGFFVLEFAVCALGLGVALTVAVIRPLEVGLVFGLITLAWFDYAIHYKAMYEWGNLWTLFGIYGLAWYDAPECASK